jgi:FAD/FMN-containing dehydrogenase
MNFPNLSRRVVLKQIASMGVIGAMDSVRSGALYASALDSIPKPPIPAVQGKVIYRQDEDYELWRQAMVWHTSIPDRFPDTIVRASSEEDVIEAVSFAAQNNLKVAIRSGGHNSICSALRDGGLLIDLSELNDVQIDASKQIVSVQPGVRSQQLVTLLELQGLTFPAPHCPMVALGGFLMGGGLGWNYAHLGDIACHSIMAVEVLTADGKLVTANAEQNPDLFWAARGAGPGFFGIVTRYHLKVYPAAKAIVSSTYIHPLDGMGDVTPTLDQLVETKDERVEVLSLLMHSPEARPEAPPEQSKVFVVSAYAFADTRDEAESLLAPFSKSVLAEKSVATEEYQEITYQQLYNPNAVFNSRGRYAADNIWTDEPGNTLHAMADHFRHTPAPRNHVLTLYGFNPELREDACFSTIAKHYTACFLLWDREEDDERNFEWLNKAMPIMEPFGKGHYVNEVEVRLRPDRIRDCFSEASWDRLSQLRQQYDPESVFYGYLGHS